MSQELRLVHEILEITKTTKKTRNDVIPLYTRLWYLPKPLTREEAVQLNEAFQTINQAITERWSPQSLIHIQKKAQSGLKAIGGSCVATEPSSGAPGLGASPGETPTPTFETICAMLGLEDFVLE